MLNEFTSFFTVLAFLVFIQQNFMRIRGDENQLQNPSSRPGNFRVHINDRRYFVDKSLFIKEAMEDRSRVISISRPRKFGKSINLSMMYYFLTNSGIYRYLFQNLAIAREVRFCYTHQNKHPAILVNFAYDSWTSYERALDGLKGIMSNIYRSHKYVKKGPRVTDNDIKYFDSIMNKTGNHAETTQALFFLADITQRFYNRRVILLVDAYDTPIKRAFYSGFYNEMVMLMKLVLQKVLEGNSHLLKAILLGTTQIALEGLFLGINNVDVNTLRSIKYAKHFGFLEEEAEKMMVAHNYTTKAIRSMKDNYDGYFIGNMRILNPLSVSSCLKDGRTIVINNFWTQAADPKNFMNLMLSSGIWPILESEILLQGEDIFKHVYVKIIIPRIKLNQEIFWSYLTHLGYLTFSQNAAFNKGKALRLPNKEVALAFNAAIKAYYKIHTTIPRYDAFVESLRAKNSTAIQNCIENYVNNSGPFFKGSDLVDFEKLMTGILRGLEKEYGQVMKNREGNTLTLALGPSKSTNDQLVFVVKEVSFRESSKSSPVKQVWVKFCSLFKKNETNVVALSLCNGLFELKLKIN